MIPPGSHFVFGEMIRDGGSLAASWRDVDGNECWLLYAVIQAQIDKERTQITGWSTPQVLQERRDAAVVMEGRSNSVRRASITGQRTE